MTVNSIKSLYIVVSHSISMNDCDMSARIKIKLNCESPEN